MIKTVKLYWVFLYFRWNWQTNEEGKMVFMASDG